MPEAQNKRIYYAVHQVAIKSNSAGTAEPYSADTVIHGVQSVGMTTNFNLTQVFELGQLAIYENVEDIPDVQVTLNKKLDGYALMYHLSTIDATDPTLAGRSNVRCVFALSIFDDTDESCAGTPTSMVQCSGMYLSSVSYNFPLDDEFNEDISVQVNDTTWTFYECKDSIIWPANKDLSICLSSGGFVGSSMLIDKLKVIKIK